MPRQPSWRGFCFHDNSPRSALAIQYRTPTFNPSRGYLLVIRYRDARIGSRRPPEPLAQIGDIELHAPCILPFICALAPSTDSARRTFPVVHVATTCDLPCRDTVGKSKIAVRFAGLNYLGITRIDPTGGAMSRQIDAQLKALMSEANGHNRCYVPASPAERKQFRRRVASNNITEAHRGMFVDSATWKRVGTKQRAMMIIRTLNDQHPTWIFVGVSAALIHGLDVPLNQLGDVHIAGTSNKTGPNLVRHMEHVEEPTMTLGLPVTPLAQTVFETCRDLDPRYGLAVCDSALRNYNLTREQLIDMLEPFSSRKGYRKVLQIAQFADGRSENGGESYSRATIIELGFAIPDLQVEFENPLDPKHPFRLDFYWDLPSKKVDGELDGKDKLVDPSMLKSKSAAYALRDERNRESAITALGIQVMRFTFPEAVATRPLDRKLKLFGIPQGDNTSGRWPS